MNIKFQTNCPLIECIRSAFTVMGVPVVSRLIQQELKPSAVSGLETTAQVCCVVYWEPQDLLCVHLLMKYTILKNHLFL